MKTKLVFLLILSQIHFIRGHYGGHWESHHVNFHTIRRALSDEAWDRLMSLVDRFGGIAQHLIYNAMRTLPLGSSDAIEERLCQIVKNAVHGPANLTYKTFPIQKFHRCCFRRHGLFAQILNANEQHLAKRMAAGREVEIGLIKHRGSFYWPGGYTMKYSNWQAGQPGHWRRHSCVFMSSTGQWKIARCTAYSFGLCEYRPIVCSKKTQTTTSAPHPTSRSIFSTPSSSLPVTNILPTAFTPNKNKFSSAHPPDGSHTKPTTSVVEDMEKKKFQYSKDLEIRMNIPFEKVNLYHSKAFKTAFIESIAKILSIEKKQVQVLSLRPGSTIVSFRLMTSVKDTTALERMIEALQSAIDKGSFQITFMGAKIRASAGSRFKELDNPETPEPKNPKKESILLIAVSVTAVVLIILAVSVTILICIFVKSKRRSVSQQHETNSVHWTKDTLGPPPEINAPPAYSEVYKC